MSVMMGVASDTSQVRGPTVRLTEGLAQPAQL